MSLLAPRSSQALSEEEEILIKDVEKWLKEKRPEDFPLVHERFRLLKNLGSVVFDYPSVKDSNYLKDIFENEYQLPETLLAFSSASHLLRTPAKVAALRSFLIAKFHVFSYLSRLIIDDALLFQVRDISFSIVFTLMTEDVYFSCLDDPGFSGRTKYKIAEDLIALWDSGTDPRSIRHLKALFSLWTARGSSPPCFGTMDGNMELLRISIDMGKDTEWEDFLKEESTSNKTRWALEEFLFGLSYEEIIKVRARLNRYGITSVNNDELRFYLDSKPAFSMVKNDRDPRAIYDFFIERRDACLLRKRVSAPGPLNTLEEIYLKYRIILESM